MKSDLIEFVTRLVRNSRSARQWVAADGLAGNLRFSPAVHAVSPAAAVTAGSCEGLRDDHFLMSWESSSATCV